MKGKKVHKVLVTFLITMLISILTTGCSDKNPVTMGSEGSEQGDTATNGKEKVSLRVWCGGEEEQALLETMLDAFKKQYGNEATFEFTVEIESEATCKDTLLGDVKQGADVFAFPDDQLMAMVAAGVLEPIEEAATIKEANSEGSVEAASVNGKLYAYPMTADNGYFMFYNKAVFTEEDVKSLNKMLEVAAASEKKINMDWSSGWYIYSFFGGAGLTAGLNEDGITNHCDWNTVEGEMKGIDVAKAMLAISQSPAFSSVVDTEFVEGAKTGKIAAGISGVWNAVALKEAWGDNYTAVKLPTYTCGEKQVQMASFVGYKMIGVNAYSKQREWANKVADWITNEENQTLRFVVREQGPSNIKSSDSEEVKNSPAIQALIQQSEFGDLQRIGGTYWDPVAAYGVEMAGGKVKEGKLQKLLDTMVAGITASQVKQ